VTQQPFPPNYPQQPQQQPPNYPGYYYSPAPDPLAPARRASILMFILGALSLCCGLCLGGIAALWDTMAQQNQQALQPLEQELSRMHLSAAVAFGIMAAIAVLPGLIYIVLGFFVRRGSMGAVIASIVLDSLIILLFLFIVVAGSLGGGSPAAVCFYVLPLALTIWLLVWLIQAIKGASKQAATAEHYQQQYWQYQQQQQQQQPQYQPPMPPPPTFDNPPPPPPPPSA